jgi:hypothetical protein
VVEIQSAGNDDNLSFSTMTEFSLNMDYDIYKKFWLLEGKNIKNSPSRNSMVEIG